MMLALLLALCFAAFLLVRPPSRRKGAASWARLGLELLEIRAVPAAVPVTYTWKAGAEGAWENPNNWNGNPGGTPSAVTDTAIFDGTVSNQNVTVTVNDVTIGSLQTKNGYMGEIKLSKKLTLQGANVSTISSAAKIAPQNNTANLVADGTGGVAQLYVESGTIGSTTNKSQLQVLNGARITFNLVTGVQLGMDLVVGGAGGGAAKGDVTVQDKTDGFQGVHLTVTNNANFILNKDSKLLLNGKDGDAWILAPGATTGFVDVNGGTLDRQGDGEQQLALPVYVRDAGLVAVEFGSTLNVRSSGTTDTNNASVYVVAGGTVAMRGQPTGATLIVAANLVFDGGTLSNETPTANVQANLVQFKGGATLISTLGTYETLNFYLFGQNAKVTVADATWTIDVRGGMAGNDRVNVYDGNLELDVNNAILRVREAGNFNNGDAYAILAVVNGAILGDFRTTFPVGDYRTAKVFDPVLPGWAYQITF
jgi:hypothetical protein